MSFISFHILHVLSSDSGLRVVCAWVGRRAHVLDPTICSRPQLKARAKDHPLGWRCTQRFTMLLYSSHEPDFHLATIWLLSVTSGVIDPMPVHHKHLLSGSFRWASRTQPSWAKQRRAQVQARQPYASLPEQLWWYQESEDGQLVYLARTRYCNY